MTAGLDNRDHVPRVLRIAQAIFAALKDAGLSGMEAAVVRGALEEHGRVLFLAEWNLQIMEWKARIPNG